MANNNKSNEGNKLNHDYMHNTYFKSYQTQHDIKYCKNVMYKI